MDFRVYLEPTRATACSTIRAQRGGACATIILSLLLCLHVLLVLIYPLLAFNSLYPHKLRSYCRFTCFFTFTIFLLRSFLSFFFFFFSSSFLATVYPCMDDLLSFRALVSTFSSLWICSDYFTLYFTLKLLFCLIIFFGFNAFIFRADGDARSIVFHYESVCIFQKVDVKFKKMLDYTMLVQLNVQVREVPAICYG